MRLLTEELEFTFEHAEMHKFDGPTPKGRVYGKVTLLSTKNEVEPVNTAPYGPPIDQRVVSQTNTIKMKLSPEVVDLIEELIEDATIVLEPSAEHGLTAGGARLIKLRKKDIPKPTPEPKVFGEKKSNSSHYEEHYPRWKCPVCEYINRYHDTFGEICQNCKRDYTLTWQQHIVDPDIKGEWSKGSDADVSDGVGEVW